ncbi:MAG: phage holin [Coriobacteriales bacterium]|jgi:hypothetical protein|nr:phage holin [Coriobacteriales bacterium]
MSYFLPDKVYQILKWAGLIALPALGTFYSTLAGVWGLPFGTEVLRTCAALGVLFGVLLGVSQATARETKSKDMD